MDDLHRCAGFIDATKAQINDRCGALHADVLQQRVGLLQLFGQRVPFIRVAGEESRAHHQAVLMPDGRLTFTPNS